MSEEIEKHVLQEYSVVRKMGNGAYGHVWRVIEKSTKKTLALKKIFDAFQHATDAQRTYREVRVLFELRHENIVRLERVIRSRNDKDLYLLFEVMEADLHSAIVDDLLEEVHFKYIIAQTLRALKFIHSAGLIHRDLKPANILLNSDCRVKLCDFGLVRTVAGQQQQAQLMTQDVATRWYRAPEVLLGSKSYSEAADLWSVGCILGEMLRGKALFNGSNTIDQVEKIMVFTGRPTPQQISSLDSDSAHHIIESVKNCKQRQPRDWFPRASEEAVHLVGCLLQFDPAKRLTAQEALRHPFLAKFHSSKDQLSSPCLIRPDVEDNVKLTVKDYKRLIYKWVKEHYLQPELFKEKAEARQSQTKTKLKKSQSCKVQHSFVPKSGNIYKSFSGLLRRQASSAYKGGLQSALSKGKQDKKATRPLTVASSLVHRFESRLNLPRGKFFSSPKKYNQK